MPIFRVKSVKIYTGQKKFTRTCSWGSWQISGMLLFKIIIRPLEQSTTSGLHKSKEILNKCCFVICFDWYWSNTDNTIYTHSMLKQRGWGLIGAPQRSGRRDPPPKISTNRGKDPDYLAHFSRSWHWENPITIIWGSVTNICCKSRSAIRYQHTVNRGFCSTFHFPFVLLLTTFIWYFKEFW